MSCFNSVLNPKPTYFDRYKDHFSESMVNQGLEKIFSIESLELSTEETLSQSDIECMNALKESIVAKEGFYC